MNRHKLSAEEAEKELKSCMNGKMSDEQMQEAKKPVYVTQMYEDISSEEDESDYQISVDAKPVEPESQPCVDIFDNISECSVPDVTDDFIEYILGDHANVNNQCDDNVDDGCDDNVNNQCDDNADDGCDDNVNEHCDDNVDDGCNDNVNEHCDDNDDDGCDDNVNGHGDDNDGDGCDGNVDDECDDNVEDGCGDSVDDGSVEVISISDNDANDDEPRDDDANDDEPRDDDANDDEPRVNDANDDEPQRHGPQIAATEIRTIILTMRSRKTAYTNGRIETERDTEIAHSHAVDPEGIDFVQTAMDIMNEVPEHFRSRKVRIVECDDSA